MNLSRFRKANSNLEKLDIDEYTDAIPDEDIEDFFRDEL